MGIGYKWDPYQSRKFIMTMVCVLSATGLSIAKLDVPEGVLMAAIAAYNLANAYIRGKEAENGGSR